MHNGAENTRVRAMNVIQLVSKERVRNCVFYYSDTLLAYYKILVLDSCNNSRKSRKSKCHGEGLRDALREMKNIGDDK